MRNIFEYLETYGWILLVVAIVGVAIFSAVQDQNRVPDYVETGESFLKDNVNRYDCQNASMQDGEYVVDCYRSIDYNNSSVYDTRSFKITEYNGSAAIKQAR